MTKEAKDMPHVMFGAWGHPQHGVSFEVVKKPYHFAHGLGLQYGLCNHLGQVNKIGQALLRDAYDKGVLNKSHVWQTDTHRVLMLAGVQALLAHHGIDAVNGPTLANEIATSIVGYALGTEDMPDGIDWHELANIITNKNVPNTVNNGT